MFRLLALAVLSLTACDPGTAGGLMESGGMDEGEQVQSTNLADLQVQPPEPITYEEARPGDIRILPESQVCIAELIDLPLREAINLSDDVGFRGSIAEPFDRWFLNAGMGSRRESVGQGLTERHRQAYRESCAWTPKNIYVDLAIGMNAAGEPYRIELTIRQADKRWRQVVERSNESDWPRTPALPRDRTEFAIRADMEALGAEVSSLLKER